MRCFWILLKIICKSDVPDNGTIIFISCGAKCQVCCLQQLDIWHLQHLSKCQAALTVWRIAIENQVRDFTTFFA